MRWAGLTVAIVALPLSMAIAIACGLSPDRGLYTAIIGGFLVSALGGSRFQIGGPAGAFIVLIFSIVERHGYEGLVLATLMAGVIMLVVGFMRWGTYIKYIPYPVTVGFSTGIAVIIFASQLKELLGLELAKEPAALVPKLSALWACIGTMRPAAIILSALAISIILGLRRLRPNWPGMLIAVAVCAALTAFLHLDAATIGTRFGGAPQSFSVPCNPHVRSCENASFIARRARYRAARRDRIVALGRRRRRNERTAAPLELRIGRAGARPTSPRPYSVACRSPARSRARRPTCARERKGRSRECCMPFTSCCSCW